MEISKRSEFIRCIFDFFRVETTENLRVTYDIALTTKYPVDWTAFYKDVVKNAEKRTLPMPKFFVDKLPQYKKRYALSAVNDGCIIRVIFGDNHYIDFTICDIPTNTTLASLKKKFEYEDEFKQRRTKIKKIIQYPKETTLIGDNIYFNVELSNPDKLTDLEKQMEISKKERELERQIKTLFISPEWE